MDRDQIKSSLIYSGILSSTTPLLMGINMSILVKKYPKLSHIPKYSIKVFPPQMALRMGHLGVGYMTKEISDSPWFAFGVMGISQGIIYGQSNVSWLNMIYSSKKISAINYFRGSHFALCRDIISQGIPFYFREKDTVEFATISTGCVIASQGIHNCQLVCQSRQKIIPSVKKHGYSFLYRGISQRLGVMGLINFLNREYLSKIWKE